MDSIDVSIITAALNPGDALETCIESVARQQGLTFEHIVIDGGSTDGSVDLLKGSEYSHLRWISETDSGIADAMNKGAAMGTGRWLYFLQADDALLDSSTLSGLVKEGDKHATGLVAAGIQLGDKPFLNVASGQVKPGWPLTARFKQAFRHQGLLISRKAWEAVGPYSLNFRITMDFDWMLRAYLQGITSVQVGRELALVSDEGLSSAVSGKLFRQRLEEEQFARMANADSGCWRFIYRVFWAAYRPYRISRTRMSS
ncbi:MAG: glycosyltransferase family 2 protein [Puniceicoccaceae bacterium]